ncbi:unnamed protein product [Caenorhabditis auriculariae]|uniref:Uncharacterized protein n=1 Tax=Caenorhabditis auriculariae TaxID=2777116 RepID=A0A8S1HGG0_9PELO|nr:unnamed protein product [Caenorhabditis auriculariae]
MAPAAKEKAPPTPVKKEETRTERKVSPEQPEDPKTARQQPVKSDSRAPSFVPVSEGESSTSSRRSSLRAPMSASAYRIETDSLNMLMNQVLEQMEKGPVNLNMIARIKAHPLYDTRPMVKELLESIIAAQPDSVQKQTSKVLQQQQSQTFSRTSTLTRKSTASVAPPEPEEIIPEPPKSARNIKKAMNERPWHSVEVGFDPDDDVETEGMNTSIASNTTEVTVQDTSFEDSEDEREAHQKTPVPTTPVTPKVVLGPLVGDNSDQTTQTEVVEEEDTDEEEYTDSEMEDLADEVELVEKKVPEKAAPPQIATSLEPNPPPDPSSSPQFLDAFDRGLIKRQSKGKYQHTLVNMYGRGVSTECESPTTTRKFFGGPQPAPELSPFLFDKAKEMIMQYPSNKLDKRAIEMEQLRRKKKLEKVKADLLAQPKEGEKPRNIYVGSVPPRTPPPISVKSDGEQSEEEEEDEEEDEESEEESDAEIENVRPRGAIISSVRRDDGGNVIMKQQPTPVHVQRPNFLPMTSPVTSANGLASSTETIKPGTSAKYLVTVAELRMKPTSGTNSGATTEPKPYHRPVSKQNGSDTPTEAQAKEEPRSVDLALSERRTSETNPLFRPNAYMASDLYRRINSGTRKTPTKEPVGPKSSLHEEDDGPDHEGKESWESAAAYIRRKNRERRHRNRTIGTADEVLRALERPSVEHTYEDRAFSPIDPFYAHHTGAAHGSSLLGYVRPRYHDDSYRVHDRPSSPTKYSAAVSREERGKSTSYDPFEHRNPYDRTYIPAPNASPSYGRKFDHDSNNWASEPRRFEVYKTRAERDAERNTLHTTPTAATSYRPSSYYSDRPVTLGYRRTDDVMRPGVESYSTYRRFDNDNRATTPGNDHYGISAVTTEQPSGGASRFRPSTRRVVSALNEADRRAYNRSRSMDRNKVDLDFSGEQKSTAATEERSNVNRSRLMTPDAPDYSYVNYHDSSNGRSSVSFDERGQPRGILKNKQSSDLDPRESSTGAVGSSSAGPVRSVIDRLKRHLSFEKSVSPQRQLGGSLTTTNRAPSIGASSRETPSASADKKKRSLLSFNRRKTSEVRLGADGKLITNGYDDSQYTKRPSSPIERIKSLFRKSDAPSSHADYYSANRTSAYPSSATAASSSPREPYVAQYRKYPGSSSRDPSTALNRYSYTPGLTDQRRHWYDDPNIY